MEGAAHAMPQAEPPRRTAIDFSVLPEREQAAAWRAAMAPLWDVVPEDPAAPLRGAIGLTHLGEAVLASSRANAQTYIRTHTSIRTSGLDQILVQVYSRGGYRGLCDDRDASVRPGDIAFLDLARPSRTREPDSDCRTLVLPRERLLPLIAGRTIHGLTIHRDTATARLVASHLASTEEVAQRMTPDEAAAAVDAAVLMIAGAWQQLREASPGVRGAGRATLRRLLCEHIERHLTEEGLGPEALCVAFRLSRATLYRVFGEDGGVAAYIRHRRLQRCFDILTGVRGRPGTILALALEHGFTSEAHFSRAFRRRYGLRPSDLRDRQRLPPPLPGAVHQATTLADWLGAMRRWAGGQSH